MVDFDFRDNETSKAWADGTPIISLYSEIGLMVRRVPRAHVSVNQARPTIQLSTRGWSGPALPIIVHGQPPYPVAYVNQLEWQTPPAVQAIEPPIGPEIDYSDIPTPPSPTAEQMQRTGPNPWASPERPAEPEQGTIIPPVDPAPIHAWPVIKTDLHDGHLVRFENHIIGKVVAGEVTIDQTLSETAAEAHQLVRAGLLSEVAGDGTLR